MKQFQITHTHGQFESIWSIESIAIPGEFQKVSFWRALGPGGKEGEEGQERQGGREGAWEPLLDWSF